MTPPQNSGNPVSLKLKVIYVIWEDLCVGEDKAQKSLPTRDCVVTLE